jgi:RNA polymerase sigma factor (TIGR02999 family)
MSPGESAELTDLLVQASGGDAVALNRVFPIVYEELRRLAQKHLRSEREGHTLNTTALVHEAYVKLVDQRVHWQNRAHFYAIASQAMRRILINYAEMRKAGKRGGGALHIPLEEAGLAMPIERIDELLALDQALERLKAFNPRGAEVVVFRFFGGLSYDEIAEVTGTSTMTVRRAWTAARSWLHRELRAAPAGAADNGADAEPVP